MRYPMKMKEVEVTVSGPRKGFATAVADCGTFWLCKVRPQDLSGPKHRIRGRWKWVYGYYFTHKESGCKWTVRFFDVATALVCFDRLAEVAPSVVGGVEGAVVMMAYSGAKVTIEEERAAAAAMERDLVIKGVACDFAWSEE